MLRNYFRIAARQILKSKIFSLINIAGLTVGITASFLIMQYVAYEMSYDQFHGNKDEIYRVALKQYENGELKNASARNFAGINALLTENCPEVTAATRFMKMPANTGFLFRYNNRIFNESGGHITADSNFFKVFPSLLLRGDLSTVLANPNSIVLSASIAKKVFGDLDPVGQRLDAMDEGRNAPYVVTGILRDIPGNSHFHVKFITKIEEVWPEIVEENWGATFIFSYATISGETNLQAVTDKVNYALRKVAEENPRVKGAKVLFQPITDIHLNSGLKDEYETNGSEALVLILIGIAVVILAIAWINYVNITTARFIRRTKEVGVRRIIGSAKSDLALQFLIEYLCISAIACVLAAALIILLLPYSSSITGIPFHEIEWSIPEVWISALVVFAIGSAVAGTYPAIFLIRLNPMAAIKGNTGNAGQGRIMRRSLVGVQFISSMILIAFLAVINAQLGYMRQTDKKIDVEKVITVRNPTAYADQEVKDKHDNFTLLEHRLLTNPSIKIVSTSSAIPGTEIGFTFVDEIKRNRSDPYNPIRFKTIFVGQNYIPLYGIKLLAGRNFRDDTGNEWKDPWERADWKKIILNESAIRTLGFKSPEEAINQVVQFHLWGDDFEPYEIIGVTEDFHHEAANKDIYPMIFSINYNSFQQVYYSIRLSAGSDPQNAVAYIERSWKEIFPGRPFEYYFLDDYYDQQFKSELRFSRLFTLFAGIAVFIASLGILGMTLFAINARMKEVSIRKVLGATVSSLLALLSQDYIKVVAWSTALSVPLIYLMATEWLSTYPTRIDVSVWFFVLPALVVVAIVTVACGFQVIRASKINPVEHLKQE